MTFVQSFETTDLVKILIRQHRVIERILGMAERKHLDRDQARAIQDPLRHTFLLHAQAEERVVYPRFARIRALAPWIHAARDEHESVAHSLDDLPDPAHLEDWRVAMRGVSTSIRRHFYEEERMLLPHLRAQLDVHEARDISATLERVLAPTP
jgi:hemerythrin superfamily protein